MMNRENLELRFMKLADTIAQWSEDKSSKVGAVIIKDDNVISVGYNGLPNGCCDDIEVRHERPAKYIWYHHAEENAIVNAAKHGHATNDCDMFVNWFPCAKCAGMIVNSGIKRLFCDKEPDFNHEKFGHEFKIAIAKLLEGGVKIKYLNYNANRQRNI